MISLILCLVLGIVDAAKDIITFRFKQSVFYNLNRQFWDPLVSWKNKYKTPLTPFKPKWYYPVLAPKLEERFPFSSTMLVFLTDAWHLLKSTMIVCICLAITVSPYFEVWYYNVGMFIAYGLVWNGAFNLGYNKLFV